VHKRDYEVIASIFRVTKANTKVSEYAWNHFRALFVACLKQYPNFDAEKFVRETER